MKDKRYAEAAELCERIYFLLKGVRSYCAENSELSRMPNVDLLRESQSTGRVLNGKFYECQSTISESCSESDFDCLKRSLLLCSNMMDYVLDAEEYQIDDSGLYIAARGLSAYISDHETPPRTCEPGVA